MRLQASHSLCACFCSKLRPTAKNSFHGFQKIHCFCTASSPYGVSVARALRSALGFDQSPQNCDEIKAGSVDEDDGVNYQKQKENDVAQKHLGFSVRSSHDIIKLLIHRVNAQAWSALDKEIQERGIEIRQKEIAWVLRVLKNGQRARELFLWAAQRPGYAHDAACYAVMIECLGDAPDQGFLNNLLAEMEKNNIQLDVASVNRLIGIFASGSEIERAEHYFLKLQNRGIKPNAFTYKCMLQGFAKSGGCTKALELFSLMQKEEQPIDLITRNMLLDSLSKNGQTECARRIFKEMKCHGPVDVYTYTIMARSYGQAGMILEALELLDDMVQNGIEPNRHTYNTILHALVDIEGRLDDAVKIFKKMSLSNVYPDLISCQSILRILCRGQQVCRARELAAAIKEEAVRKEVCENFIKSLSKMGHLQEICALFQIIKAGNLQPSLATCLCMIDALCRGGEPNEAMLLLKEVEEKAAGVPLTAYNSILSALRNRDQFQAADDLFRQMKTKGPLPNVVSYNIIISMLAKMGQMPYAERLFEEMGRLGCTPSRVTFNTFLHCYARKGDVKMVRRLLQMMHANEVSPDVVTYNCTIECFAKAKKPKVAVKVFKEMKEKGVSPSFVTYNHVITALADACMPDAALSVFEQMKEQGFVPDALTFSVLCRVYESDPHLDKRQLVEEIQKAGLEFDLRV